MHQVPHVYIRIVLVTSAVVMSNRSG